MPAKMWEKIRLRGSVESVRGQIQKHLQYMPEFYKSKCQARYERIQEYLRRINRLENDPNQPVLTVKKSKVVKREAKREARAKKVALIENVIEKELLDRLQKGVYGEIYNLPQKTFQTVLEKHGVQQEMEEEDEIEYVEDSGEELESEEEIEYEEEFEPSEQETVDDLEDLIKIRKSKRAHVEVEYELEDGHGSVTN